MITRLCWFLPLLLFIQNVANATDILNHYRYIEKEDHQIHLLEISPQEYVIKLVKAPTNVYSPVQSFCKANHALAGINGGFFHEGGIPAGILKIKDKWYGFNHLPRAALGWNDDGQAVLIDRVTAKKKKNSKTVMINPQKWQNFTYIVQGAPLLIKNGKIVKDHNPEKTQKSFLNNRHARTAVCLKKNHHWLLLVAAHTKDEDRSYVEKPAAGLTISELAHFLKDQGCVDALNLDGGNSSTMVINNKVMNSPAGDRAPMTSSFIQRSVSDAILIFES